MSKAIYWRCFHCGQGFTKAQVRWAKEHFGATELETPACQMRLLGEGGLLAALRDAQDELADYRAEDGLIVRAMHSMSADHATALRREEELGYERACRDLRHQMEKLGIDADAVMNIPHQSSTQEMGNEC